MFSWNSTPSIEELQKENNHLKLQVESLQKQNDTLTQGYTTLVKETSFTRKLVDVFSPLNSYNDRLRLLTLMVMKETAEN